LSQTQISQFPVRLEAKTIFRPSGENCGLTSCLVEEISVFAGCFNVVVPESSICQTLVSAIVCDQASRLDRREIAKLVKSVPADSTNAGVPPAAGILHKLQKPLPPRFDRNKISRPSGIQANFIIVALSKVSLRGAAPSNEARNRSLAPLPP